MRREAAGARDNVGKARAGGEVIAAGMRDFAADRNQNRLLRDRQRDPDARKHADHVAALGDAGARFVGRNFAPAGRAADHAVEHHQPTAVGHRVDAACIEHRVGQLLARGELVDTLTVDAADDGDLLARRRDVDHVAVLQHRIAGLVAAQQQVVEVEIGDQATVAAQLHRAEAAAGRRPSGGEHGIDQGRQAAHRVRSGPRGESGDVDGDAVQARYRHLEVEVAVLARNLARDHVVKVAVAYPAHGDGANLRHEDAPVVADPEPHAGGLDRAGKAEGQLVAGIDPVVWRDRGGRRRGEIARPRNKQFGAEAPQGFAGDLRDVRLELVGRGRRRGRRRLVRRLRRLRLRGRHIGRRRGHVDRCGGVWLHLRRRHRHLLGGGARLGAVAGDRHRKLRGGGAGYRGEPCRREDPVQSTHRQKANSFRSFRSAQAATRASCPWAGNALRCSIIRMRDRSSSAIVR